MALTEAQQAVLRQITTDPEFVNLMNDPESAYANRSKPSVIAVNYYTRSGATFIRIGASGKILPPKFS